MHILLTTFGLILVLALFSIAQWRAAENMAYFDAASRQVFIESRSDAFDEITDTAVDAYLKLRPPPQKNDDVIEDEPTNTKPDSFKDPIEEKPSKKRTSFLHITVLFSDENPTVVEGRGKACYTLLKNLINELYSGQDFFEDAKEVYPDLEELLILNMIEKAKQMYDEGYKLENARELATLNLEDKLQSYVRYKAMTGNKSRRKKATNEEPGYFPLIELVSMKNHTHLMSLWLAPRPLLMALFQNEDVVEDLIQTRREIYNDLRKDRNKSALETKGKDLKLRFSSYLQGISPDFIDFEVSRTYPRE